MTLRHGCYDIQDLNEAINRQVNSKTDANTLKFVANNSLISVDIFTQNHTVSFNCTNSMGSLLGYSKRRVLSPMTWYHSDQIVNINPITMLHLTCNIIQNSYENEKESHILASFTLDSETGYLMTYSPSNPIFLPLNTTTITKIVCCLINDDGEIIDLNNERLCVVLHIRRRN